MPSGRDVLFYLISSAIPIYLWAKLIKTYLAYKREFREKTIFYEKHNCVVTYSPNGGMYGWPVYKDRLPMSLDNYWKNLEPILFFIDTSEKRMDISVMRLSVQPIIEALISAAKRGVRIRMILDSTYSDDMREKFVSLTERGAKIIYCQSLTNPDSIMHNKYVIKDLESDGSGFTLCGSLNWTQSAFSENYEFMVLSTNSYVVSAFNMNFEESWRFLQNSMTQRVHP